MPISNFLIVSGNVSAVLCSFGKVRICSLSPFVPLSAPWALVPPALEYDAGRPQWPNHSTPPIALEGIAIPKHLLRLYLAFKVIYIFSKVIFRK